MLTFILNLLTIILGIALGLYILLLGRRSLWATLGIIALVTMANLLAVFVAGTESGRTLIESRNWLLLGIAVTAGVVGVYLGKTRPEIAVNLIGFFAGAYMALWLYDISDYLLTAVAELSQQTATVVGLVIILIGGMFGVWFIRSYENEGLILITMLLGVDIIRLMTGLSSTSNWTAVILLSLALVSVVVQYADYLRELKAVNPLVSYSRASDFIGPQGFDDDIF